MSTDIFALAEEFESTIAATWEKVLQKNAAKLKDAYERGGDMAYGTYLDSLFRPIHKRLRELGLKVKPRLPGDFNISREWGVPDETDQQRWMWSTVVGGGWQASGNACHHHLSRPYPLLSPTPAENLCAGRNGQGGRGSSALPTFRGF